MEDRGTGRFVKRLALFVVALAVLLAAWASPAAAAPLEAAGASAPDATAGCEGPCPILFVKKGPGTADLWSEPLGLSQCPASVVLCDGTWDDLAYPEVRIYPKIQSGYVSQWQNCTTVGPQAECVLNLQDAAYLPTICVTLLLHGSPPPPVDPACPPAVLPTPPPPRPAGPPRLGSRCTIPGSGRADVIRGTSGRDVICGRGGNDRIYGRGGHDLLVGGTGADKLYGGSGSDRLSGGRGDDAFYARDGVRDYLLGGSGRDRARRDRRDRASSVERRF